MTEGNEKMKTIDAASDTYAFSSYLSFGVWIALSGLVLFALIACLLRPSGDFGLARRPKGFWMGALGAGALVMVWPYIMPVVLPFSSGLRLAAVIASVFYLGPEQQRMGSRGTWRRRRRGGGSGRGGSGRGGW